MRSHSIFYIILILASSKVSMIRSFPSFLYKPSSFSSPITRLFSSLSTPTPKITVSKNIYKIFYPPPSTTHISKTTIAAFIAYEDNHILVIYKPPRILTQGDDPSLDLHRGDSSTSTSNVPLLQHIQEYLSAGKPGKAYLGMVHRLDRPTSGLLVFAKTSKAASRLSVNMANKSKSVEDDDGGGNDMVKSYIAIIKPPQSNNNVNLKYNTLQTYKTYITKTDPRATTSDSKVAPKLPVTCSEASISRESKPSEMSYTLFKLKLGNTSPNISMHSTTTPLLPLPLISTIDLKTGRKHQIRASLSSLSLAILGDTLYNQNEYYTKGNGYHKGQIALHSHYLGFDHPVALVFSDESGDGEEEKVKRRVNILCYPRSDFYGSSGNEVEDRCRNIVGNVEKGWIDDGDYVSGAIEKGKKKIVRGGGNKEGKRRNTDRSEGNADKKSGGDKAVVETSEGFNLKAIRKERKKMKAIETEIP